MSKDNHLIILSGPVGAGKSTVAKELIAGSTVPTVYIEGDTFWKHLVNNNDVAGRHKNFRIIMRAMVATAIAYAASGCETILDFSLPPWFIPTVCKMVGSREIVVDYVVLHPSEPVCISRALEREEGRIFDYSSYHDLYLLFGEMSGHTIVDDVNSAAIVATLIREQLPTSKFSIYPKPSK